MFTALTARDIVGHVVGLNTLAQPAIEVGLLDAGCVEVGEYTTSATYARQPAAAGDWDYSTPPDCDFEIGVWNTNSFEFPTVPANEFWRVRYLGIYEAGTDNLLMVADLGECDGDECPEKTFGPGCTPYVPQYGAKFYLEFFKPSK